MPKKSIALATVILLIILVSIAGLGLSFFIIERIRQVKAQEAYLKAYYLSKAGVNDTLYLFRKNSYRGIVYLPKRGYFPLREVQLSSSEKFKIDGKEVDLLMVDTRRTSRFIIGWFGWKIFILHSLFLRNPTSRTPSEGRNITLDRMIISWDNNTKYKLYQINIGGRKVWGRWNNPVSSPADCNIDYTLLPQTYLQTQLFFKKKKRGGPDISWVNITFVDQEGEKSQNLKVFPGWSHFNFRITSEGSVDYPGASVRRKVEFEYNAASQTIEEYREVQ